jgi:hypothetical protein
MAITEGDDKQSADTEMYVKTDREVKTLVTLRTANKTLPFNQGI